MPIYIYNCKSCGEDFKVSHGMTEEYEACDICESSEISRIPSVFSNVSKKNQQKKQVCALTRELIEESHIELKEQRDKLRSQRKDV